ncbi:MAG: gamma carbonic anhydrase family protein [Heliobacteriaceae bacterium]|nr:gamma carbonic anhydrase family protein [Heliobacteriaceae bacterium]
MAIYEFEGKRPVIGKDTFVHPEATIIGDVVIGEGCYIGPGARLRGDWGGIVIGDKSNIQENCVIHTQPDAVTRLGAHSHIAHGAVLHGPQLGYHVFVGMNALIMDNAQIGDECCIGGSAFVRGNTVYEPNKLIVGVPAKVVGDIPPAMRKRLDWATDQYIALPPRCFAGLKEISREDCR